MPSSLGGFKEMPSCFVHTYGRIVTKLFVCGDERSLFVIHFTKRDDLFSTDLWSAFVVRDNPPYFSDIRVIYFFNVLHCVVIVGIEADFLQ
jgi:hypothetical protein